MAICQDLAAIERFESVPSTHTHERSNRRGRHTGNSLLNANNPLPKEDHQVKLLINSLSV
jgi:hypothetical protein